MSEIVVTEEYYAGSSWCDLRINGVLIQRNLLRDQVASIVAQVLLAKANQELREQGTGVRCDL